MIALIDYKAGNLTSVKKALATIGAHVFVPETPEQLSEVAGVIVPGVGHYGATRLQPPWGVALRCSASASVCSGCLKEATKRRRCLVSACCPAA